MPTNHIYRYGKKMSELTEEDIKSMRIANMRSLLGLPLTGISSSYPTPKQRIGTFKVPGFSTMKSDKLAKTVLHARDLTKSLKRPFQSWNASTRRWIEDPDPMVEWGSLSPSQKYNANKTARTILASRSLPPELVNTIVPRVHGPPEKKFEVGDILSGMATHGLSRHFYKVVGHTTTGNPKLRLLPTKKARENVIEDFGTYKKRFSYYEPDVSANGKAAKRAAKYLRLWNGRPNEIQDYGTD
jgi:hypothetical protein